MKLTITIASTPLLYDTTMLRVKDYSNHNFNGLRSSYLEDLEVSQKLP